MKKLDVVIFSLFVVTFVVWYVYDILQLFWTPLTQFGMTHWVPELVLIFLIGYDSCVKMSQSKIDIISIAVFLFPFLYYIMAGETMAEYVFGFGAGCVFSGVFLSGVWTRTRQKGTAT